MFWVDNAWVILALPLAALLIIFGITRPLELAARPKGAKPQPAAGGHGGHAPADIHPGLDESHTAHGNDQAVAAHEEEHGGGGHGGHGGKTPFWGMVGSAIGTLAMLVAFIWAILVLIQFLNGTVPASGANVNFTYDWFIFGPQHYTIGFRVDTLTAVMLVVVTSVSMLVNLYSIGYMAGDPGYSRFFIELALFTASMLILVLGANLLVLFIGWELVGLSSYLLIGFWFDQAPPPAGSDLPYPPPAALKAFVTTRIGDFGMLIGLLILWTTTGTFNFVALNNPHTAAYSTVSQATITLAMILIFLGAVGKSAQFPLHVWLPDAMAGPTPVSALIHAATMVAAGVYLVARFFPLYHSIAGPQSLEVVGYVGGFTALFAASIALTQNDIKKVLAYSTVSQLGYMFVGLAVSDNSSLGIFHLFTHAFFKALLFLGSGSVIHAIADQDMRKMGGLAKFMPITAATFLIATLSISGIPPFSGFWSKDAIIGATYEYGTAHGGNYWLYGMTLFTAFLTAFYMFRLYFMTFGGRGSGAGFWGNGSQYRGQAHPHESPWTMALPLLLLAIPAFAAGFWSINNSFANFYTGTNISYASPFLDGLTYVGIATAIVGIGLAWLMYGVGIVPVTVFTSNLVGRAAYNVLLNKYYFDEFYGWIIKYIALGLARLAAGFDRIVIDGIVNGSAITVRRLGDATRRSETGVLQNYGVVFFGGALVIVLILFIVTGTIGR